MAPKWKSSIPIAGVAAMAAMAFPGIANAAVVPNVNGSELTLTGDRRRRDRRRLRRHERRP